MQNYVTHWGKRYYFDNLYEPMLELSMVKLLQAGEIIAGNGHVIVEHRQRCLEISYVVSGCCDFYADGQVFHAKQGDIHVISTGTLHKIVADEDNNLRMAYIGFTFQPDDDRYEELRAFYQSPPRYMQNDRHHSRTLFEQLFEEIYAAQPYSREAMDACITQILIHVWRIFTQGGESENRRFVEEARIDHIIGKGPAEAGHERRRNCRQTGLWLLPELLQDVCSVRGLLAHAVFEGADVKRVI